MEKQYINKTIESDIQLSGPIPNVIDQLTEMMGRYERQGWRNLELTQDTFYDYGELKLIGERLETDAEFKARMVDEEKKRMRTMKQKEREYRQYLKLKSKFESESETF